VVAINKNEREEERKKEKEKLAVKVLFFSCHALSSTNEEANINH